MREKLKISQRQEVGSETFTAMMLRELLTIIDFFVVVVNKKITFWAIVEKDDISIMTSSGSHSIC